VQDGGDEWDQKCRQQSESMSAAVERARKRREANERRFQEEQRAGAREKLRQLEEKFGKKPSKVSHLCSFSRRRCSSRSHEFLQVLISQKFRVFIEQDLKNYHGIGHDLDFECTFTSAF